MLDLMTYIEEHIDGFKAQVIRFSLNCITKKMMERKYKMLKKRLAAATALAAGVAAIPVQGLDVVVNTVFSYRRCITICASFGSSKKGLIL